MSKRMETDPRQQIQSPDGATGISTNSIVTNLPADVKAIRALRSERHIPVSDIVEVVSSIYPRFDRYLLSKVEHGEAYGIRLQADAAKVLILRYAPELLRPSKKPQRKKPNRVQARLPDALFAQLQLHLQQTGKSAQDFLEELVTLFFSSKKE